MSENYEHYISRNIRAFYKRRLFSPILYLLILALCMIIFPLQSILKPNVLEHELKIDRAYEISPYETVTFSDLYFTGYTSKQLGNTNGYYYYTNYANDCCIVLLNPKTCEEGLPYIEKLKVTTKIVPGNKTYHNLLSTLAKDLEWTENGIVSETPDYFFSQPAVNPITNSVLFLLYFGTGAYALICLILYLIYMQFPSLSPTCQNLIIFGHPKKILAEAEEELLILPQLATEDMFITEHYFILTSPYGNAIIPIQEILWIYKYSTLHKFLWYHFNISYTLHITTNRRFVLHCPKNTKSDIDGIMDYLAEANHNILVGFSEENRLQAEAVLGKPFHIEKLYAFLRRKI